MRNQYSRIINPLIVFLCLVAGSSCAGEPPEVPRSADGTADSVLMVGRQIWSRACSSCHAPDGSGGRGPSVHFVEDRYPSIDDQLNLVSKGRGSMPGFGGRYTNEELEAVVRYTREVL